MLPGSHPHRHRHALLKPTPAEHQERVIFPTVSNFSSSSFFSLCSNFALKGWTLASLEATRHIWRQVLKRQGVVEVRTHRSMGRKVEERFWFAPLWSRTGFLWFFGFFSSLGWVCCCINVNVTLQEVNKYFSDSNKGVWAGNLCDNY